MAKPKQYEQFVADLKSVMPHVRCMEQAQPLPLVQIQGTDIWVCPMCLHRSWKNARTALQNMLDFIGTDGVVNPNYDRRLRQLCAQACWVLGIGGKP